MKIIRTNGLKIELKNLDYNFLEQEMKKLQSKGKNEKVSIYASLLSRLDKNSTPEEIQTEVNKLISENREKVKNLHQEIKKLNKEINTLAKLSDKETDDTISVITSVINSL